MSSTAVGHCYCGSPEISNVYYFLCVKCKRMFHEECLKSDCISVLKGDFLFNFKCQDCGGGEEELTRLRLQWTHVVQLALYNLQHAGSGMCGYFRWKEHICTFIDKHWATFFGSHRKKTSLWHGTVAGVLSSGCPNIFLSGAQELRETGWWRLAETKPPSPHKIATPVSKPVTKKKEMTPSPTEPPKEGLRSRRGKTSIQAAMELKAKRATLLEAKEIRKTKLARSSGSETDVPVGSSVKLAKSSCNETDRAVGSSLMSTSGSNSGSAQFPPSSSLLSEHLITTSTPVLRSPIKLEPGSSLTFTGLFSRGETTHTPLSSMVSITSTGSSSTGPLVSPCSSSLQDYSDENSNVSQSSYLTEKDLKLQTTLPNLLLSDDVGGHDADDSDFEIDPGTLSPPPMCSPIRMQDSPTVHEMLSAIGDTSNMGSSIHDSYQESVSMDTSNQDNMSCYSNSYLGDNSKDCVEDERSVVDSESDSDSESDGAENRPTNEHAPIPSLGRKRRHNVDKEDEAISVPVVKCHLLSLYEERLLLRKLETVYKGCDLPPHINRFRRKLLVRKLKREYGLPIFDLDAEMNKLSQISSGIHPVRERQMNIPGNYYHGETRVLDKFQTLTYNQTKMQLEHQPSFLNRLVGYEDDQLHPVCSPYTARILKPFIRRDYESRPLKMQLLHEIKAHYHRKDETWLGDAAVPIDFCYVRPQHIPSINTLCREFFWPGIDLSECLQYPDFSCVVLYRKIVIGFAFMVPDVKQNEAYISFIFTHPDWRRANIAAFMLYHLIQTCMGKDVTLHCSATNAAMLLYQKFGFKPEEFILDFYDKYFPADSKQCKHAFFLRLRR